MATTTPFDAALDLWRIPAQAGFAMLEASARFWSASYGSMLAPRSVGDVTINFPFGQGFSMNISPWTSWDIGNTQQPAVEREILDSAGSYGRQLGRMMDLIAVMAPHTGVSGEPLRAFTELKTKIDGIKHKHGLDVVKASGG